MTQRQPPKTQPAPSSAGAKAIRCGRGRPRCSTRCCRSSRSTFERAAPADLAPCSTRVDEVRLESGFGGGEHLMAEAERHPDTGFIGIEPFVNGMAKALAVDRRAQARQHPAASRRRDRRAGLAAVRLARALRSALSRSVAEAAALEAAFRAGRKRRTDRAGAAAARRIPLRERHPGLRRLDAGAADALAALRLDRRTGRRLAPPWPGFTSTRYEAKAMREGRVPCYLIFRRRFDSGGVTGSRTCQKRTTRCAVAGESFSKLA